MRRCPSLVLGLFALVLGASLSLAAEPKEVVNSLGQKLVLIPAGEFLMGGPQAPEEVIKNYPADKLKPDDFGDEYPRHSVKITKPFFLGRHETTVGQFKQFVADTKYVTEGERNTNDRGKGPGAWGFNAATQEFEGRDLKYNWKNPGFEITDDMPVVNVSWNDAQEFLKWLSKKEGQMYRLPTEAEWEYACRGGTTTQYWSGNDPETLVKIANICDHGFYEKYPKYYPEDRLLKGNDGHVLPAPVGSYRPNAFGLYDMHGNAWEWTNDWYSDTYYQECKDQGVVADPQGPTKTDGVKIRRGGAWHTLPAWCRASFRNINTTISRYPNLGFRVVMNVAEPN